MKALSIRQPWAWFILHAGKDIENRDWQTTYRGRILVHAAKGMTNAEYGEAFHFQLDLLKRGGRDLDRYHPDVPYLPEPFSLDRGALVGTVEVVGMVLRSDSPWFFGIYGWQLRNPIAFENPIPWKGALGLFDVPDEAVSEQRQRAAAAGKSVQETLI